MPREIGLKDRGETRINDLISSAVAHEASPHLPSSWDIGNSHRGPRPSLVSVLASFNGRERVLLSHTRAGVLQSQRAIRPPLHALTSPGSPGPVLVPILG